MLRSNEIDIKPRKVYRTFADDGLICGAGGHIERGGGAESEGWGGVESGKEDSGTD